MDLTIGTTVMLPVALLWMRGEVKGRDAVRRRREEARDERTSTRREEKKNANRAKDVTRSNATGSPGKSGAKERRGRGGAPDDPAEHGEGFELRVSSPQLHEAPLQEHRARHDQGEEESVRGGDALHGDEVAPEEHHRDEARQVPHRVVLNGRHRATREEGPCGRSRRARARHLLETREDASLDTPRRLLLAGNVPHTRAPPGARARSRMTTG
jgi:hypothetical protein